MGSLPPHHRGRGESSLRGAPVTCATRISATNVNQTSEVPPADSATASSGSDAGASPVSMRLGAQGPRCDQVPGIGNRARAYPNPPRAAAQPSIPEPSLAASALSSRRPALTAPALPAPAQPPPAVPAPPSLRRTAGQGR